MSMIAKHYVTISGRMFTPGEIITEEIEEEKLKRLTTLGAVMIEPSRAAEEDIRIWKKVPDGAKDDDAPGTEAEERSGAESEASEDDEDEPAIEIDVMDGIVPPETKTEKRTTEKRGKKA